MSPDPEADLHWTAFLYAAGELPPEEEAAFERRLEDDQAAREAVAGAVELAGALASLGPDVARRRRPGSRWIPAFSALAAAACLALATAWALRPSRPEADDAAEVAMAWSGLRTLDGIGAEVDWTSLADDAPTVEPPPSVDPNPSAERGLPSWLLSAASAPQADAPQEEN